MEEKEFVALVNKLEDLARRNPGEYKCRVALLAAHQAAEPLQNDF